MLCLVLIILYYLTNPHFQSIKVLKLLEKLDLSAYKKTFKKEKVNGYMMCRLDEETLEKELGVKKHLHRIRLMEVITGKIDVRMHFPS